MSEHTPGLLTYEPAYKQGFVIWGGTDSTPVEIVSSCDDEGRWGAIKDVANARRLVAAWNACDGLPTETLEIVGGLSDVLRAKFDSTKAERDSLRAVNAELLEALKTYQRAGIGNSTDFMVQNIAYERGLAAIASARKQENPHG